MGRCYSCSDYEKYKCLIPVLPIIKLIGVWPKLSLLSDELLLGGLKASLKQKGSYCPY